MDRRLGSHMGETVMYNTNRELLPSLVQRKLEKGRPGDKLVTFHRENGQAAGREVLRLYLIGCPARELQLYIQRAEDPGNPRGAKNRAWKD